MRGDKHELLYWCVWGSYPVNSAWLDLVRGEVRGGNRDHVWTWVWK